MATPTTISTVLAGMTDAFGLVGSVITNIINYPLLLFLLAAGLIPVGIKIFRSLRGAASGGKN